MPRSKKEYQPFRLTAAYIESAHDDGVNIFWPGIEPVHPNDCLDLNLLESAAEQPFQSGYGMDFYPTIYDKAACLFFLIAGGHIFSNGNKRTAVIILDQFLLANAIYLLIPNEEIQALAEGTASYKLSGLGHKQVLSNLSELIKNSSVPLRMLRKTDETSYRRMHKLKRMIREYPMNQPGAIPEQRRLRGSSVR